MSMSLIQKILFPGIAPILRKQILSLPLHQRVKAFVGKSDEQKRFFFSLQAINSFSIATYLPFNVCSLINQSCHLWLCSDHPAGPLTIHFWAPTFKWGISIANLADLNRPAEKVSVEQQTGNVLSQS